MPVRLNIFFAWFFMLCAGSAQADFVSGNLDGDNFLALRSGPGAGFELIQKMGPGTELTIIGSDGRWREVELQDGARGWAHGRYILEGSPTPSFVSGLAEDDETFLALRSGPGVNFRLIRKLGPGTVMKSLASDGQWQQVALADDTVGWAYSRYISEGRPSGAFHKAELVDEILQTNAGIADESGGLAGLPAARLWIHLRREDQVAAAHSLLENLSKGLAVAGANRAFEAQPIQVLDFGPVAGQVRYFRKEDAETAQALANLSSSIGLPAEAVSLIEQFSKQSWIEVGHLELWLP